MADLVTPLASLLVLRWAAFIEAEREAVAAFDDVKFSPLLPAGLQQDAWHSQSQRAPGLTAALHELEGRHDTTILKYANAVAPAIRQCAERDPMLLGELVSWVTNFAFETSEGRHAAAIAFDEELRRVVEAEGKYGGEFTTPTPVVELMIQLVNPQPGDRIYDPCFGVGGLLVAAAQRLRTAAAEDPLSERGKVSSSSIFGVEINPAAYVIGLCRIVLGGIEHPGLELGDALERPLPRNRTVEGFDCILAAPPWGSRIAETKARQYPVPTGTVENLFLQHVMANLRPGGRAVVALPEGTLFRTGPDRQVRKALLSEFRVDGVVSLPEEALAPCTSISSSLVVFRRESPRENIRFVRIARKGWPTKNGEGLGSWHASRGAQGDKPSDRDDRSGEVAGSADGPVPLGRLAPTFREVTALIRHERERPASDYATDLETWEVPARTLAARDYELIAKRTGDAALEETLGRLRAADPNLQIYPLSELAEVVQGVSYDREGTTDRGSGGSAVPLIRVADITDRNIRKPTLFFTAAASASIRAAQRLRPGDVLFTTSGTVGKIGVVEGLRELVGAAAAKSLAVIRPHGGVAPAFLAALLRSNAYQEWILGHARGSTIQHLSVRVLRNLPVPVPPLPVQDAVLRNVGVDALASLVQYATGGTTDPVAAWLQRPVVLSFIAEPAAFEDAGKRLSEAGRELRELKPIRNKVAHAASQIGPGSEQRLSESVSAWLIEAVEAATILDGIDAVPRGAPRLAVLELAKGHLEAALLATVADHSPVSARAGAFTAALLRLAEHEAASLLGAVSVAIRMEPTEVVVDVPTEVRLHVQNDSTAGLRNLRVTTRPDVGTGESAYLPETAAFAVPLTIQARAYGLPFQISVSWSALRLDGTIAKGEGSVDLLVRSTRDVIQSGDLGPSPYIVGNPVDREEMFYGRTDIIERIRRQVGSTANANVILLEGNRRTGKTSILKQLQKAGVLPGWVVVYCSFQDAEGDETRAGVSTLNVYRLLARTIGWGLFDAGIRTWFPGEPPPDPTRPFKVEFRAALNRAFSGDHPFETFELYLGAALSAASPNRVLLMLDEFDKLQEGIDAGVTSPQVPENIRHILQHHPGLSAILTGSRRLKRLREEYWSALFGLGYRVEISSLPPEDARRLVTEPVAGRLSYLPKARDRVVELCAAQPFLVQSLCNRIFERAASAGERTVTTAAVTEAASEMVRENEHFRTLWDYAKTHRRRLLLAMCEQHAGGPDPVSLEFLLARLETAGVQVVPESALGDDLEFLRELELIELDKSYRGGTYRVSVPLLGMWIKTSIDFDGAVARAREEAGEAHS